MGFGWLVLGMLAACSSDADRSSSEPFRSGSRLRARVEEADGQRLFVGWVDDSLGMDCWFATAEDGALRCVPPTASLAYADAQCGEPVVLWTRGCPLPDTVGAALPAEDHGPCAGDVVPTRAHRVERELAIGEVHYRAEDGRCGPAEALSPGTEIHELGPVVAADDLVEAREEEEPRGDRLSVRFLVGDDGSRQLTAIHDTGLGVDCLPMELSGDERRCIPIGDLAYAFGNRFADPGCTEVAAYDEVDGASCPSATKILQFERQGCGPSLPTLHEVGDPIDPGYHVVEEACVAYDDADAAPPLLHVGPVAAADEYVRTIRKELGTGTLRTFVEATEAGEPLSMPDGFRDAAGAWCSPMDFADGSRRCVAGATPYLSSDAAYFADASCTQELVELPDHADCPREVPEVAARVDPGACSSRVTEVVSIGAPFEGTEIYMGDTAGACRLLHELPEGYRYLTVGEPASPDLFPIVRAEIE